MSSIDRVTDLDEETLVDEEDAAIDDAELDETFEQPLAHYYESEREGTSLPTAADSKEATEQPKTVDLSVGMANVAIRDEPSDAIEEQAAAHGNAPLASVQREAEVLQRHGIKLVKDAALHDGKPYAKDFKSATQVLLEQTDT